MKLELVVLPVGDVDRAKNFYKALGWREDADFAAGEDFRMVQMIPPGSPCSVIFGTGITSAAPGSAEGLQLGRTTSTWPGPNWPTEAPR
jgi:catechol 2,3-dioxygenase-like lactoylglutathione lyase family enzyme